MLSGLEEKKLLGSWVVIKHVQRTHESARWGHVLLKAMTMRALEKLVDAED